VCVVRRRVDEWRKGEAKGKYASNERKKKVLEADDDTRNRRLRSILVISLDDNIQFYFINN